MHTTESLGKRISITGAPSLDSITVYIDDVKQGQGHIVITCYGKSWTAYWGGMGTSNVVEFFTSTDEYYLLRCLHVPGPAKKEKSAEAYLLRIILAVKQGLKDLAELKETAASVGMPRPTISREDLRALGYEIE